MALLSTFSGVQFSFRLSESRLKQKLTPNTGMVFDAAYEIYRAHVVFD